MFVCSSLGHVFGCLPEIFHRQHKGFFLTIDLNKDIAMSFILGSTQISELGKW